jgi:hypothetical protein
MLSMGMRLKLRPTISRFCRSDSLRGSVLAKYSPSNKRVWPLLAQGCGLLRRSKSVRCPGYTGRVANAAATTAHDPLRT